MRLIYDDRTREGMNRRRSSRKYASDDRHVGDGKRRLRRRERHRTVITG